MNPSTSLRRISSRTASLTTGDGNSICRHGQSGSRRVGDAFFSIPLTNVANYRRGDRPRYVVNDIAPPSRYGSIGGLVTSANVCCKYLNSVGCWAEKTVSTRSKPIERERLLAELGHLLDDDRPLEIPAVRLQQVVDGPAVRLQFAADRLVQLRVEVERLRNDDLLPVQLVNVAEFLAGFVDDAGENLVVVEPFAGGRVEGDHLPRLELAAGDDLRRVQAVDAGLGADVEPAAVVGAPPHRSQAHAVDQPGEHSAVGGDDAGRAVPRGQAAERPPAVGEQVHRLRAPVVGLRIPDRRHAQPQRPQHAPALRMDQMLDPLVEPGRVAAAPAVSRSRPGSGGSSPRA